MIFYKELFGLEVDDAVHRFMTTWLCYSDYSGQGDPSNTIRMSPPNDMCEPLNISKLGPDTITLSGGQLLVDMIVIEQQRTGNNCWMLNSAFFISSLFFSVDKSF